MPWISEIFNGIGISGFIFFSNVVSFPSIPITNKKYNYINPFFHSPTNTLYFSSNLDNGLGGYDLYSAIFHSETNQWDEIENLGYPINSPYDEKNLCLTNDGSTGFISTQREGGFGIDIAELHFLFGNFFSIYNW